MIELVWILVTNLLWLVALGIGVFIVVGLLCLYLYDDKEKPNVPR